MALVPPNSWSSLKYPERRHEVLLTLEEVVTSLQGAVPTEAFDIDDVYHMLFDDTELGNDVASEVGCTLIDHSECHVIQALCQTLDDVL